MAQTLNRVNALLLGLVAILAALLWWPPHIETGTPSLTELKREQVRSLTIQGLGDAPFNLIRRDQQWWLMTPRELPADQLKTDALLALVEARIYDRFAMPPGKLKQPFITDGDRHWVRFDQLLVTFGQSHPLGQRRYLSVKNDAGSGPQTTEIVLVNDLYYHHLRSNWIDWVSHQPLPTHITLTRIALPELTLVQDQLRWQSTPPASSSDDINQLVSRWKHLWAMKVTELPPGSNLEGLNSVTLEWLDTADAQHSVKFHLHPLSRELQLLDSSHGLVYHIDPTVAAGLLGPQPTTDNH